MALVAPPANSQRQVTEFGGINSETLGNCPLTQVISSAQAVRGVDIFCKHHLGCRDTTLVAFSVFTHHYEAKPLKRLMVKSQLSGLTYLFSTTTPQTTTDDAGIPPTWP